MSSSTIQLRTVRDDGPSVSADTANIVEEASWDKFDDSDSAIATTSNSSHQRPDATAPKSEGIRHRAEQPPRAVEAVPSGGNAEGIELSSLATGTSGGQGTLLAVGTTTADPERGTSASQAPSVQAFRDSTVTVQDPTLAAVHRRKSLVHFVALCGSLFVNGWNDATTGPMLPRIQEKYNIGFAVVSLIFVFGAAGFLGGALANVYLTDRFGFGKVLFLGSLCQVGAYVVLAPAGPFPLICFAYFVIGFTLSIQVAQATGYVASLKKDSNAKMGYLHGTYGLGALLSPLVATEFAKSPKYWSFHYIISAGLYVVNTTVLWYVFRGKRQEEIMADEGEASSDSDGVSSNKFRQMIGNKDVHFLSVFALIYVGVEVTMGGWSVTYILEQRHGSSNAGYISSGFFGGIMLGRVLLLWFNQKIGERRALFLYVTLVIGLEATVWVVPSLVGNAVAVSLVGLFLGPMFPILMNHSTTILPRWLLTACAGYIAGAGQAGSAVLPFITGVLASKFGITTLPPFSVTLGQLNKQSQALHHGQARHPNDQRKLRDVVPISYVGDTQVRNVWGENGPRGEVEVDCIGAGNEVEASRAGEDDTREVCVGAQEMAGVCRSSYEGRFAEKRERVLEDGASFAKAVRRFVHDKGPQVWGYESDEVLHGVLRGAVMLARRGG
ncbi:Bypass of stop codon protein 6 [Trametes pubescens]|uniref:Bypass of stop codon protein 6 n=1 Tax=Trametes pubescens TaxID=154538 RepID=A0A1M2VIT0_TRAPU|nr:Bypass of stop codon protein 6 [Trametes pubescens]